MITEVRGSLASRYAEMLSLVGNIPVEHFDTSDSSIAIIGTREGSTPPIGTTARHRPTNGHACSKPLPEPTTPIRTDSPETTGR